jgi:hypothetical protein
LRSRTRVTSALGEEDYGDLWRSDGRGKQSQFPAGGEGLGDVRRGALYEQTQSRWQIPQHSTIPSFPCSPPLPMVRDRARAEPAPHSRGMRVPLLPRPLRARADAAGGRRHTPAGWPGITC